MIGAFLATVICTTPTGSLVELDDSPSVVAGPISDGSASRRTQTVRGLTLIGDWTCREVEQRGNGGMWVSGAPGGLASPCASAHLFCLPIPAHTGVCPGKPFRTGGWMDAVKNPTGRLIFFADDWSPQHARALGLIPLRHCPPSLR